MRLSLPRLKMPRLPRIQYSGLDLHGAKGLE